MSWELLGQVWSVFFAEILPILIAIGFIKFMSWLGGLNTKTSGEVIREELRKEAQKESGKRTHDHWVTPGGTTITD